MPDAESPEAHGGFRRALPAVRAAVDRIIPVDRWPSGWDGGVGDYLTDDGVAHRDLAWARPLLSSLARRLDDAAAAEGAEGFAGLPAARQDDLLAVESGSPEFDALRRVCWEGYYAAANRRMPAGLEMVGYRPVPPGVDAVDPVMPATVTSREVARRYDAVIVGSGPGGGVAAQVLTEAGRRVLLVERTPMLPNSALRGDHLHGKRNAVYWPSAGPGPGHPRLIHTGEHDEVVDGTGDAALYGLNADALGGGTRIWQGMSWRFLPEDFEMATAYGNPDGASLADWPIGYDEMEPHYTRAEWELGVAGEEGALTRRTPRSAGYPMPAMGSEPARELLARAAETLGWGWGPIPLAINSVPREGRPACVRCPQCVGHACPVDAKNGAHNTFVARAVASGGCDLLVDAEVIEVRDGTAGAGVTIMADASGEPVTLTVDADVVIVAAGAIETPRLLLASGVGNDHVGRHLHDHRSTSVVGMVDDPVKPFVGPGHSIATLDHVHSTTIPWGGGVLVDLMGLLPLASAMAPAEEGVATWGAGHKQWMREGRPHVFGVFGMGQEIPMPTSRVTLADRVRDRWGRPGAGLRKNVHAASRLVEDGMARQGERWLEAAGVRSIHRLSGPATASAAGEHSCGTMRMGDSPETSATDAGGRVHGARRIFVCDSSLHPTNGSVNPTLTIIANAFRVSQRLVEDWPR